MGSREAVLKVIMDLFQTPEGERMILDFLRSSVEFLEEKKKRGSALTEKETERLSNYLNFIQILEDKNSSIKH